jgi:hypothetical protein
VAARWPTSRARIGALVVQTPRQRLAPINRQVFTYGTQGQNHGRPLANFALRAVLLAASYATWTGVGLIFPWLLLLFGGTICVACRYGLSNSYRVRLGRRGLYAERKLLGVFIKKRFIAAAEIKGLLAVAHGSSQVGNKHTQHFVVDALLDSGKRVRVVEMLDGRAMAEQARDAVALLSGLKALKKIALDGAGALART